MLLGHFLNILTSCFGFVDKPEKNVVVNMNCRVNESTLSKPINPQDHEFWKWTMEMSERSKKEEEYQTIKGN